MCSTSQIERMDKETYCAYNTTRDCFLSSEVTLIDTARDPLGVLKVLVEGLAEGAETGLWLTSLTTMPMVPRISPFDVVYLDKNQQVTNLAALLPGFEFPVFESPSVSALVLPLHTILATQTHTGDQLRICIDIEVPGQSAVRGSATQCDLECVGRGGAGSQRLSGWACGRRAAGAREG